MRDEIARVSLANRGWQVAETREKARLFGRPILHSDLAHSLVDQVCEILLEEIHGGRWEVGERLPGASALAEESGLSRSPIQRAFEKLRERGYLRQEHRSGTYLASIYPKGLAPGGSIGIAIVLKEQGGQWYTFPHTHHRLLV